MRAHEELLVLAREQKARIEALEQLVTDLRVAMVSPPDDSIFENPDEPWDSEVDAQRLEEKIEQAEARYLAAGGEVL